MTYHPEEGPKEVVCPTDTDLKTLTVPGKGVVTGHPLHVNLFLVRDCSKPDKTYSPRPWPDSVLYGKSVERVEVSLIGFSWPIPAKLHAESNFLPTDSFTPGCVQAWWSERVENVDLIQTDELNSSEGIWKVWSKLWIRAPKTLKEAEVVCVAKS